MNIENSSHVAGKMMGIMQAGKYTKWPRLPVSRERSNKFDTKTYATV